MIYLTTYLQEMCHVKTFCLQLGQNHGGEIFMSLAVILILHLIATMCLNCHEQEVNSWEHSLNAKEGQSQEDRCNLLFLEEQKMTLQTKVDIETSCGPICDGY